MTDLTSDIKSLVDKIDSMPAATRDSILNGLLSAKAERAQQAVKKTYTAMQCLAADSRNKVLLKQISATCSRHGYEIPANEHVDLKKLDAALALRTGNRRGIDSEFLAERSPCRNSRSLFRPSLTHEFEAVRDELYDCSFPRPDPTTGMFDLVKIDQWMDARDLGGMSDKDTPQGASKILEQKFGWGRHARPFWLEVSLPWLASRVDRRQLGADHRRGHFD